MGFENDELVHPNVFSACSGFLRRSRHVFEACTCESASGIDSDSPFKIGPEISLDPVASLRQLFGGVENGRPVSFEGDQDSVTGQGILPLIRRSG